MKQHRGSERQAARKARAVRDVSRRLQRLIARDAESGGPRRVSDGVTGKS